MRRSPDLWNFLQQPTVCFQGVQWFVHVHHSCRIIGDHFFCFRGILLGTTLYACSVFFVDLWNYDLLLSFFRAFEPSLGTATKHDPPCRRVFYAIDVFGFVLWTGWSSGVGVRVYHQGIGPSPTAGNCAVFCRALLLCLPPAALGSIARRGLRPYFR